MPPRLAGRARSTAGSGANTPAVGTPCSDAPSNSPFKLHANELYDSPERNSDNRKKMVVGVQKKSMADLVKEAANMHAETTLSANRALKVVEDTKDLCSATMKELNDQGKTLGRIDRNIDKMNEDLTYSEKLLRYMSKCCCWWMFDSCTGADPEGQKKKEWENKVDRAQTSNDDGSFGVSGQPSGASSVKGSAASMGAGKVSTPRKASLFQRQHDANSGSSAPHRDPDIRLRDEYGSTATHMHSQTRKQNDVIDKIGSGLEYLMNGAKDMQEEVESQNQEIDRINGKFDNMAARMKQVNTKSLLGKMKG